MDLFIPIAQSTTGVTDTGVTDAGKAIALGVGAGLGSIGAGIGDSGVRDALRCLGERNQHFNHESALLCLVAFGDGAADVDRGEGGEDERLKRCDQADL